MPVAPLLLAALSWSRTFCNLCLLKRFAKSAISGTMSITNAAENDAVTQLEHDAQQETAAAMATDEDEQKPEIETTTTINNNLLTSSFEGTISNKGRPRLHYWSSYEELQLVEQWRQHSAEILTLQTNLPIFRRISDTMRQFGFQVNPQDCRRKLNSLRNKYILERRKLESIGEENPLSSEWRLYPLVHCILAPSQANPDLQHELRIVNRLLSKLAPSTYKNQPAMSEVAPTPKPAATTITAAAPQLPQQLKQSPQHNHNKSVNNPYRRVYNPRPPPKQQIELANTTATVNGTTPAPPPATKRLENGLNFLLKLKHHFIEPVAVEQLRVDNQRLAEERDTALERLQKAEIELQLWQAQLSHWQEQQEQVLQRLQCGGAEQN